MDTVADLLRGKLRLYQRETELWKADHQRATAVFDFDEYLADGVQLFEAITRWDEDWRSRVLSGEEEYAATVAEEIKDAYRWWLTLCAAAEAELETFEREFRRTQNGDRFRQCYREARGILTPDEDFFAHDALVRLRDAAIDTHRRGGTVELCEPSE